MKSRCYFKICWLKQIQKRKTLQSYLQKKKLHGSFESCRFGDRSDQPDRYDGDSIIIIIIASIITIIIPTVNEIVLNNQCIVNTVTTTPGTRSSRRQSFVSSRGFHRFIITPSCYTTSAADVVVSENSITSYNIETFLATLEDPTFL